jgi:hypothetical protein
MARIEGHGHLFNPRQMTRRIITDWLRTLPDGS